MCGCESYECLEVIYNPCSEGAQLNIVATETGNWSAVIYFNGQPTPLEFSVTSGQKIIIPTSVLNEFYTHEFVLYNAAGTLVDCYHLKSMASGSAGDFTPLPPSEGSTLVQMFRMGTPSDALNTTFGSIIQINNSNTIQFSNFIGATLLDIQQVTTPLQPATGVGVNGFNTASGTITLAYAYEDTYFKVIYTKNS